MRKAIYPGSFDPITKGHIDIILRASKLFDKLYVCVAKNLNKTPYFTLEERLNMVKVALKDIPNVEVIATDKLIVSVAKELNAIAIVRGLRAVTDFEYEFQLAAGNEYIDNNIEMVFLMASLNKSFISSSSIKEFYSYNVDITKLVPPIVVEEFNKKKLNNKN
ncbi:MAG: pantetheine-phosphate adenylyltransferase [Bacilli bacterium]